MPNIVDKLETEAKSFMKKNEKKEEKTKKDMTQIILYTQKLIERLFLSLSSVNIYNLTSIINSEVRPIIEDQRYKMQQIINGIINDNYEVGIETGEKFLKLTNEKETVLNKDEVKNEETLLALLLYGKKLIDNLNDDTIKMLDRDLTSIYISSKNDIRNTDPNNTVNTILTGAAINKYISPTFKNITTRAEVISQTETNRALNHGILLAYLGAKKEIPDLKVKWVEIRDHKLCKYCRERANGGEYGDGIYDIGTVSPPPMHPNCRCILIPYSYRW